MDQRPLYTVYVCECVLVGSVGDFCKTVRLVSLIVCVVRLFCCCGGGWVHGAGKRFDTLRICMCVYMCVLVAEGLMAHSVTLTDDDDEYGGGDGWQT